MKQTKKKSEHYVNNKEFLAAMVEYKKSVNKAKRDKVEKPPVPDYIGGCFLKIANHLSYRPNFINYTYRDDMISDGIENCLAYIDNFNPEKSNNPFAYFTQIIYYAYLRRIQKEKRQTYIKYKATEKANIFGELADHADDIEEIHYISNGHMEEFIGEYEETKRKKNEKRKQRGIEKLLADKEAEDEANNISDED